MEPSQGLHLASGMIRAGLADVGLQVIPHHALASEPLFEEYRQNRLELDRKNADEFLLELTVLAHGRKAGAPGDAIVHGART